MIHDFDKLKININNNIRTANELIPTLKKYIDVSDHRRFLSRLTQDFIAFCNLEPSKRAAKIPTLVIVNFNLNFLCNDMRNSIHIQTLNKSSFNGILAYSPEMIDTVIKNIPQHALHTYMCRQDKLIINMLAFCSVAKLNGVKIFNLFNDDDIISKWIELSDVKKGLCFGLSSLFLLCSFVSDRQKDKFVSGPEDDLRWFYRCVILLQLNHYEYSTSQKQDITRFISLVLHLQNSKMGAGVADLFPEIPAPRILQQSINFCNTEFSGDNFIAYEYTHSRDAVFMDTLLQAEGPLYIQFGLHDYPNSGHAVSLHRNPAGMFTFYDPSVKVEENIKLQDEKDFLAFKRRYLVNRQDTISVTIGRSRPKTPPPEELPVQERPKKRLRIIG